MPHPSRFSFSRRRLGFCSAFVLALSRAATSHAFAQSAYQPGWTGGRSSVVVDLSVLDGGGSGERVSLHRAPLAPPEASREVTVDLSVLDTLGAPEAAGAERIVLHRPTHHDAVASHHFHLHRVAHVGHRHMAHRNAHPAIRLASAKTKTADAQCCPIPGAR